MDGMLPFSREDLSSLLLLLNNEFYRIPLQQINSADPRSLKVKITQHRLTSSLNAEVTFLFVVCGETYGILDHSALIVGFSNRIS